jgi:hypothetical protein
MNNEEIETAIIGLLFDLHAFNLLNLTILNSINIHFKIDTFKLCKELGITYNI